ncbi:MAG: hypothetical protein AAF813_09195 [Pseudomonadota bacterium]
MPDAAALDAALSRAGPAEERVALYRAAAEMMTTPEARRFHLTHAWIYALEAGEPDVIATLEDALRDLGGL